MRRPALGCLLLLLAGARSEPDEGEALVSSLPAAAEAETLFLAFAKILHTHGGNATRLFDKYNRFHDTKHSGGEQALGVMEVRELFKDIGLGNLLLRGELAKIAIVLLDSSGDRRVSLRELRAALDVARCWVGEGDPASEPQAVLAPLHHLGERLGAVGATPGFKSISGLVQSELHACAGPIGAWWDSGWLRTLQAAERGNEVARAMRGELPRETVSSCVEHMVDRVLRHAKESPLHEAVEAVERRAGVGGPRSARASARAVRGALQRGGLASPLLRHLVAAGLVGWLDADADRRLNATELGGDAAKAACQVAHALVDREATAVAVLRALSLPAAAGGYPPRDFAKEAALIVDEMFSAPAILGMQPYKLSRAQAYIRFPDDEEHTAAVHADALELYVRLAPPGTFGRSLNFTGLPNNQQPTPKEELR